jgi:predicted dehydrogenase
MNFALLGNDSDAVALALAAAGGDHALVWGHDLGAAEVPLRAAAPGMQIAEYWEELLDGTLADVVIVAAAVEQDAREEQLRKLTQAAVPLVVSHPVVESMLLYYELDMVRRENHAVILPYLPHRWHPAWQEIAALVAGPAAPLGALEQVIVEHFTAARTRWPVLRGFARDLELVRPLCGRATTVAAMTSGGARSTPEATNYATLGVQMSASGGALVRWSMLPAERHEATRFSFIGQQGKAVLDMPQREQPWTLEVRQAESSATRTFDAFDAPSAALADLVDQLGRKALANDAAAEAFDVARSAAWPPAADWLEACQTMELVDAVEHSMERGRAISPHYEMPTEQATFKGMMSGAGCFLLLIGLTLLVVATTAAQLGVPLAKYWPYVLLCLLATFLLLQSLRLLFPRDERMPPP